jgi:hypothetical protein
VRSGKKFVVFHGRDPLDHRRHRPRAEPLKIPKPGFRL